ncbi:MAG: N-formylglutamate deformylase [Alphaproteobacteria bacterium]|nr:N-formylglutamate deformylase [Alphaproteobacteria bacterium]MBV9693914.1 N-formylglutamate deformylase [Alphaproteobacteria bacterium]
MADKTDWLEIGRGRAPLVVAFPHTGSEIPDDLADGFVSLWQARRDADWWVDRLYDFVAAMDVTTVRTRLSRSVIDVNRDPSGRSLYPGQATTELCPTTDFDGTALYRSGLAPDADEIARRRRLFFEPYHAALEAEIERLRARHGRVVLFDAHSIRSRIPRLFEGELPQFNIGSNGGRSCARDLSDAVARVCASSAYSFVVDGRFKGGWTTRHYGAPDNGVHAIQLELACRGYMDEPEVPSPQNWPAPYDPARAGALRGVLKRVIAACLAFAGQG